MDRLDISGAPDASGGGLGTATDDPLRTLVRVPGNHLMTDLLGSRDELLDVVEDAFPRTAITVRGNEISLVGPDSTRVGRLFSELVVILERGHPLETASVRRTIDMINADESPAEVLTAELLRTYRGGRVRPKTSGQKRYVDAIAENTITFGVGPAGTGKSWLAVAMAVQSLHAKEVERIVLTRPAVEAGERLGFLPGDLMAKVDPYLRPLYDALHDMVGAEGAQKLLERGVVEVAPLAFMRGRTLNNSFIILDEAQNTSPEQMKMFLTRIGFGSKAVVTGDATQVDVAGGRSGLTHIESVLGRIEGLGFVRLSGQDVVRHRIVQDIVDAYERNDAERAARDQRRTADGGTDTAPERPMSTPPIDPTVTELPAVAMTSMVEHGDAPSAAEDADDEPPSPAAAGPRVLLVDDRSNDPTPVDIEALGVLIARVLQLEGAPTTAETSLTLVEAPAIAQLKAEHLGGDGTPTDVLSFPVDGARPDAELVGDVVICPSVAASQAPEHAGSLEDELALLVVHAALHLSGWDHELDGDRTQMWDRERELVTQLHRTPVRDPWRDR